jgi:hypothetical protein
VNTDTQAITLISAADTALRSGNCTAARVQLTALVRLFNVHRDEMSPAVAAKSQSCIGCLSGQCPPTCWSGWRVRRKARLDGCRFL